MFRITLCLLLLVIFSCQEEESTPQNSNGFTADGKFYATPYGSFQKSGDPNDFSFAFTDKKVVKDADGNYSYAGLANNTMSSFSIGDLSLSSTNAFVGEFIFDDTESLPMGIDDFGYLFNQKFDNNLNLVNPPPIFNVSDGWVSIKSKSGNTFDIVYEATFDNGVSIQGVFKGDMVFIEN